MSPETMERINAQLAVAGVGSAVTDDQVQTFLVTVLAMVVRELFAYYRGKKRRKPRQLRLPVE